MRRPTDSREAPEAAESPQAPSCRPGATLSLKARALKYLAMREHSRIELRRKLGPHAESVEQVEALLDECEAKGWLSAERFAASMVHRKAARYGTLRLQAELAQHRLPDEVSRTAVQALRDTEFERAHALWLKRYGEIPESPQDRARQSRFLAARGFASEVIRRVLRGEGLDPDAPKA